MTSDDDRLLCLPPGLRQFRRGGEGEELSSAAGRLGGRLLRRRRLTQAIANGRYKAVNMVGAGVIAAVANALGRRPFPFVFGGDGASFAVSPSEAPAAARRSRRWRPSRTPNSSSTCAARCIPVREIRAAARDVRVARFGAVAALRLCDVRGRRPEPGSRSEAKRGEYRAAPRAGWRASRLSRTLLPLGRRAGQAWPRAVGDRRAARRRSALIRRCVDEVVGMVLGAAEAGGRSRSRASASAGRRGGCARGLRGQGLRGSRALAARSSPRPSYLMGVTSSTSSS